MLLGFISDIHEDIRQLDKALGILEKAGVDEIICLGDMVGYNSLSNGFQDTRNGADCIRQVQEKCCVAVIGNHDLYAIRKTPEHTAGFDFGKNWYDLPYEDREERGDDQVWLYEPYEMPSNIGDNEKAFLERLPEFVVKSAGMAKILLSHYIYPNITGSGVGFTANKEDFSDHFFWMDKLNCSFSFSGHGHIEGFTVADVRSFTTYGFGCKVRLPDRSAVTGPCVVRGKKQSGVLLFDATNKEIEAIALE